MNTSTRFLTHLAVACAERGDTAGAFEANRHALEINPHSPAAFLNLGYLHAERGEATEARFMWERVIELDARSEEAQEAREHLRA